MSEPKITSHLFGYRVWRRAHDHRKKSSKCQKRKKERKMWSQLFLMLPTLCRKSSGTVTPFRSNLAATTILSKQSIRDCSAHLDCGDVLLGNATHSEVWRNKDGQRTNRCYVVSYWSRAWKHHPRFMLPSRSVSTCSQSSLFIFTLPFLPPSFPATIIRLTSAKIE